MHFNVENKQCSLNSFIDSVSLLHHLCIACWRTFLLVSKPKSVPGHFPREIHTSGGGSTTHFVVEKGISTRIRPFYECLDPVARQGGRDQRGPIGAEIEDMKK
jgi:hypothetical protein